LQPFLQESKKKKKKNQTRTRKRKKSQHFFWISSPTLKKLTSCNEFSFRRAPPPPPLE